MRRRYGIGGVADDDFDSVVDPGGLRKLLYFTPGGAPMNDDVEWEIAFRGVFIRFTTKELRTPRTVADKCMDYLNVIPPMPAQRRWDERLNEMLQDAETIEIPFETSPHATTLEHLRDFVNTHSHAKNMAQLFDGLVLKKSGLYRFRFQDLVSYIREKSRAMVHSDDIKRHLDVMKIKRDESTATINGHTTRVVYYEVDEAMLSLLNKEEPEAPPPAAF